MANAQGIDISHWQTLTAWSPNGLTFVVIKASEGTVKDWMYDRHVAKARAAGLLVGAYAFNRADVSMSAQVDAFIKAAGDVDFYAIDVEEEGVSGRQKFSLTETREFITSFKARTGKKIGLYMSASSFYFTAGQDFEWIAHWGVSVPASNTWDIHQYRGSPLDLDQFNGTAAEMRAWVYGLNNGGTTTMNTFTVPEARTLANVKDGAWLYDNSDLASSPGNIKISPARALVYVGQVSWTPDIRIVAYEPPGEDSNSSSKAMFIARDSISGFAVETDKTPYSQNDIDMVTAATAMPLQKTIEEQALIISQLKTDAASVNGELEDVRLALDGASLLLAEKSQLLEDYEVDVTDYDGLREALRKAVAP